MKSLFILFTGLAISFCSNAPNGVNEGARNARRAEVQAWKYVSEFLRENECEWANAMAFMYNSSAE